MAFKLHVVDGGLVPGMEYLPAGAITPKAGLALVQKMAIWILPQERTSQAISV